MIKAIYSTGFICVFLVLIIVMGNVYGQAGSVNLPLSESETEEGVVNDKESIKIDLNHNDQLKTAEKPTETQLNSEKTKDIESKNATRKKENRKSSILKSNSSLVTVFYVLVSYLLFSPFDSTNLSNQSL